MKTIIVFNLLVVLINGQISQKICATGQYDTACQQIARDLKVACNYNFHSVDCLLNIKNNRSHLGRITGEEALLGAGLLPGNVVVLGEIVKRHPPSATVVIVKNEIPSGFQSLQGKKLCHPGFKHDSSFSQHLLQELEYEVLNTQKPDCRSNVTLLERHISTLHKFFGPSCRPGPWTQNSEKNSELQEKYQNLCSLCGSDKCKVEYEAPFNDSLKCLLNNDADVAVTSLQEAEIFFNKSSNAQTYKYLCKDGSSKSTFSPCVWSRQLPDLLVAERYSASNMEKYLRASLNKYINSQVVEQSLQETINEALKSILNINNYERITFLQQPNYQSLEEYVRNYTTIPSVDASKQCDRTLKWCTYSDKEQEKCTWLSQAAVNWGIQPVVECIRSTGDDELSCLDDLKKGSSDLVVASSDYAYISLNKNLESIAFPETDTRNLSIILAVKNASNPSINSLNDLKGKRACIPQFGGKEHLAFVDVLRSITKATNGDCDYGQFLSKFLGNSCVPGVRSSLISEVTIDIDKDKLCELCEPYNLTTTHTYCNADAINKFYGSAGALDCLREEKSDFAVITKQSIENDTGLTVICRNNTLANRNGLDVDSNCALSVIASSEVVVRRDSDKRADIELALYEFEKWFGQNLKKPFHLFDRFDNELDLLFKDSTPGLNFENDLAYIKDYKDLLSRVKTCNKNGTKILTISVFVYILTVLIFVM